jgi:3-deoxy-D-manno-octulosonic acid (KDO) 8-phosphate synthase
MEIHRDPSRALSDGANTIALKNLKRLLTDLIALKRTVTAGGMV